MIQVFEISVESLPTTGDVTIRFGYELKSARENELASREKDMLEIVSQRCSQRFDADVIGFKDAVSVLS